MYKNFFKRFVDIVASLIALPFILIIILIMAPIIYINDPGPIFYNGERVGKNGKIFKMHKFRSMYVNSKDIRNEDGSTYNGEDDPRVTKVGKIMRKLSIDELPQILNVLLGDMSLVGPRPATPLILENTTELQAKRLEVRPGITGYTQMMYRNSAQGDARYVADKYYVENLSFALDVSIIFKTVLKVIKRENIYNNGEVAMESNKEEEKVVATAGEEQ